jgi:hypothetical protein
MKEYSLEEKENLEAQYKEWNKNAQNAYKNFMRTASKDDKDYKSWMWLKGSGFLSYSMAIDNCVETLYNKIKKQEKKQKKQGNKIDIPNG